MTSSLAAIHVAKKGLGLDDETYRAVLRRVTGKDSAKDLSEGQRGKVLEEFRRLGWGTAPSPALPRKGGGSRRRKLTGKYAGKLQALWIAGWHLGIVREKDDKALLAFLERQTKISDTRFLRYPDDAAKAIEALKGWLAREGGVDWSQSRYRPAWRQTAGSRIAQAQWAKLCADHPTIRGAKFRMAVREIAGRDADELTEDRDWIPVMNAFGGRVRAAKAAANGEAAAPTPLTSLDPRKGGGRKAAAS